MTIPDKLLQAVAQQMHLLYGGRIGYCYHETGYKRCEEDAHRVLCAALSALDCDEVIDLVAFHYRDQLPNSGAPCYPEAKRALVAISKLGEANLDMFGLPANEWDEP